MRMFGIVLAAAVAIALVIGGLYAWQAAPDAANDWGATRPDVAAWAIRSGAVASVALAQVLLVTFVAGAAFGRRSLDRWLASAAAVVVALSAVGAVAFALASR